MIDDKFGLYDWISDESIEFIETEEQMMMIDYNFPDALDTYGEFLDERVQNFKENFDVNFLFLFYKFLIVIVVTTPGTFSAMSPLFTAMVPSLLAFNMIAI